MINPGKQAIESMARISFQERALIEYLEAEFSDVQMKMLHMTEEVQLRILQGRAQQTYELLKLIKEASEIVRKA